MFSLDVDGRYQRNLDKMQTVSSLNQELNDEKENSRTRSVNPIFNREVSNKTCDFQANSIIVNNIRVHRQCRDRESSSGSDEHETDLGTTNLKRSLAFASLDQISQIEDSNNENYNLENLRGRNEIRTNLKRTLTFDSLDKVSQLGENDSENNEVSMSGQNNSCEDVHRDYSQEETMNEFEVEVTKQNGSFGISIMVRWKKPLTLSYIMLKNGQTYFENLVVLIPQDF